MRTTVIVLFIHVAMHLMAPAQRYIKRTFRTFNFEWDYKIDFDKQKVETSMLKCIVRGNLIASKRKSLIVGCKHTNVLYAI